MTEALETKQLSFPFSITGDSHTLADDMSRWAAGEFPTPPPTLEKPRLVISQETIDRKLFDNKRDTELIAAGYFYCKAHLRAIPIADRSPRNPDYCRKCYAIIQGEKPEKNPDGWSSQTFIHFGKKYVVATSPRVSSQGDNFLRELRNYRFDDDKQAAPSEKIARIVTEPLKPLATARTIAGAGDNLKTNDKKCLFCGKLITWGNKKTRYCSDGCRTAEYRRRKAAV